MDDGEPCGICGRPMLRGTDLELHHIDAEDKARGRPGDVLTHHRCNRGERRGLPPRRMRQAAQQAAEIAPARLTAAGFVLRTADCEHPQELCPGRGYADSVPPCPACGGSTNSRA